MKSGIEKISVYPGSMCLSMKDLAAARQQSIEQFTEEMMIDERSVIPPWEDTVTMAVNAAKDLLTDYDRKSIGLLIVATESGLDHEKALSTWIHNYLSLADDCRNAELKMACYGGTAALFLARASLSMLPAGKKVLVITTDTSRAHFNEPYEFVLGCAAVAFIVSNQPDFIHFDSSTDAVFSYDVSDTLRPTSRVDAGHSETSLLSYLEGITTTFERYMEYLNRQEPVLTFEEFRKRLPFQIYHSPFAGITLRAHKAVHKYFGKLDHKKLKADYDSNVLPSLKYNRRMSGTYASSIFVSLIGLAEATGDKVNGATVGIYSYGSGSCAEFYTGTFGDNAAEIAKNTMLGEQLDNRRQLSVDEYESVETEKDRALEQESYQVNSPGFESWRNEFYVRNKRLTFEGIRDYIRLYKMN